MIMNAHLPFLRAVAANPADNLPRLVYADFLEETGEPSHVARAHFIRGQIALAGMVEDSLEERRLNRELGKLFAIYHRQWVADSPAPLQESKGFDYHRGFVKRISLREDELAIQGEEAFEIAPIFVLFLVSNGSLTSAESFDRFAFLERILTLRLFLTGPNGSNGEPERNAFLSRILATRVWSNISELDLSDNPIDDAFLVRLLGGLPTSPFAAKLRKIDLGYCHALTDAGASALASARGLENLESLALNGLDLSRMSRRLLVRRFGDRVVF